MATATAPQVTQDLKSGDLVIELNNNFNVEFLQDTGEVCYPFRTRDDTFTKTGYSSPLDVTPSVVLANDENIAAIKTLMPDAVIKPFPKRGSELSEKLLRKGRLFIAFLSDLSDEEARNEGRNGVIGVISKHAKGKERPFITSLSSWRYAVPINDYANELIDLQNDESELETGDKLVCDQSMPFGYPIDKGSCVTVSSWDDEDSTFMTTLGLRVEMMDGEIVLSCHPSIKFRKV